MADVTHAEPFDVPGYRIVRRLGRGGMADVYLAIQLSLGRPVAIKVLAAERTPSDELITRFEQEARTIARLDHPHIVGIFDVGRTSTGQLYYTMPYVPNGDLGSRDLREDRRAVIAMARAMCQALAYAHEQGIVHRDVKPENVLFDKLDRPLLADFGIALTNVTPTRVTREGDTIGSVSYMSPEQQRGQALDGRSDLYSLGVVCYECLTGKLPFEGPDALAIALAHVEQPIPRLPPTHRHWQGLIDKALAKDPEDRFQSASEMLDSLDAVERRVALTAQIANVATTLAAVPERIERRLHVPARWRRVLPLALGLIAIAAGAAWLVYRYGGFGTPSATSKVVVPMPDRAIAVPASPAPMKHASAPTGAGRSGLPDSTRASLAEANASLTLRVDDLAPDKPTGVNTPPVLASRGIGSVIRDADGPPLMFIPAQTQIGKHNYHVARDYALGRYEVTRGEYARFVAATKHAAAKCRQPLKPWSLLEKLDWRTPGFIQRNRDPVVCVSWNDAAAYARWMSQRTGHRYRLPRRVEWQHAARMVGSSADVCRRGNVADDTDSAFINLTSHFSCNDGYSHTSPVGHYPANALGVHDLLGNVSEWVADCLPGSAWARLTDDARCPEREFVGMSWHDGPDEHNLTYRGTAGPDVGYTTVGFRLMRDLSDD